MKTKDSISLAISLIGLVSLLIFTALEISIAVSNREDRFIFDIVFWGVLTGLIIIMNMFYAPLAMHRKYGILSFDWLTEVKSKAVYIFIRTSMLTSVIAAAMLMFTFILRWVIGENPLPGFAGFYFLTFMSFQFSLNDSRAAWNERTAQK